MQDGVLGGGGGRGGSGGGGGGGGEEEGAKGREFSLGGWAIFTSKAV